MEMTMARGSPDNTQHPSPHEPQLHIFFWFSSSPVLHPIPASISIPLPPALRRSPVASYLPASSVHHPHPFSAHPSPPRHWPPPPAMCIATPLPAHNPNRRSPAPITRRPFQLPPPPVSPPPLPPPPTITTKGRRCCRSQKPYRSLLKIAEDITVGFGFYFFLFLFRKF